MSTYKAKHIAKAIKKSEGKKASTDDIMAAAEKHKKVISKADMERLKKANKERMFKKKSTFKPKTEKDLPKDKSESELEMKKRLMRIKARDEKFKTMPLKPGEEGKVEPIGTHDPSEKPVYKKL